MRTGPSSLFLRALRKAPPVHPVEKRQAKLWIKKRLAALYPELRNDPAGLEAAYQALDLEPKAGSRPGDPHSFFEMRHPE